MEVFAKNPDLLKSCGIWPYSPEAVLAVAAAVAGGAMSASVADVAEGGAVAAVGATAAAAAAHAAGGQLSGGISISNTLQRLEPTTGTAMVLVLLEAVNTEEVRAAAAVLRGERKRAPLRKPGKKRLWGWATGPEWGGPAGSRRWSRCGGRWRRQKSGRRQQQPRIRLLAPRGCWRRRGCCCQARGTSAAGTAGHSGRSRCQWALESSCLPREVIVYFQICVEFCSTLVTPTLLSNKGSRAQRN